MESAKNKKSSPDAFEGSFQTSSDRGFASWHQVESRDFAISKNIWQAILADPAHRSEVDALVEQRANERIEQKLAAMKEEARAQGFNQGIDEARASVTAQVGRIEQLFGQACETLVREKHKVLTDHESAWCEALQYCLNRFLVPEPEQKLFVAKEWLEQSLSGFSENAIVVVFLNPADFDAVESEFVKFRGDRWEFRTDPRLGRGEIRAECEGGGIHYNPAEQREKLDLILKRVTQSQK